MVEQLELNKKIVLRLNDLAFIQHKPDVAVAKITDRIMVNTIRQRQVWFRSLCRFCQMVREHIHPSRLVSNELSRKATWS